MRSEVAANLNVLEFVKIFGEICKTLGVRWSNRYGVTAPSTVSLQSTTALLYIEIIPLLQSHHILLMAGRGRGRGRGKKYPKKPAKKSSYRKKAPPNPTPPHLPSDDASSHHE